VPWSPRKSMSVLGISFSLRRVRQDQYRSVLIGWSLDYRCLDDRPVCPRQLFLFQVSVRALAISSSV